MKPSLHRAADGSCERDLIQAILSMMMDGEEVAMDTVLKIEGMHCTNCLQRVKRAVSSIPGVAGVDVSLEVKQAFITHDGNVGPGDGRRMGNLSWNRDAP